MPPSARIADPARPIVREHDAAEPGPRIAIIRRIVGQPVVTVDPRAEIAAMTVVAHAVEARRAVDVAVMIDVAAIERSGAESGAAIVSAMTEAADMGAAKTTDMATAEPADVAAAESAAMQASAVESAAAEASSADMAAAAEAATTTEVAATPVLNLHRVIGGGVGSGRGGRGRRRQRLRARRRGDRDRQRCGCGERRGA